jgi:RNA-binding protein Nova
VVQKGSVFTYLKAALFSKTMVTTVNTNQPNLESPQKSSSTASSSESSPAGLNQPSNTMESTAEGTKNKEETTSSSSNAIMTIKLLVPNSIAGAIIGRSGQTISDIQKSASCRVKLSQSGDYYPGTTERVCLIQGNLPNIKDAVGLVLHKLYDALNEKDDDEDDEEGAEDIKFNFAAKLLVPTSACGMIIGKSGNNIKSMIEATGVTSIKLSPKRTDSSSSVFVPQTFERILTINGTDCDSCLDCVYLILDGVESYPEVFKYTNMTTTYSKQTMSHTYHSGDHHQQHPSASPSASGGLGIHQVASIQLSPSTTSTKEPISVEIAIPDNVVGAILGKSGKTLADLQSKSNARIKISQRGVFVPGTTNRIVTISGPNAECVALAQYLIHQEIQKTNQNVDVSKSAHHDD